jgi:transposase
MFIKFSRRSLEKGVPMDGIIPQLRWREKENLLRHLRQCRQAGLKTRYLILANLLSHRSARQTAQVLSVSVSTVYRVAQRFREAGEVGLLDRREDNGEVKLNEHYLAVLIEVVRSCPGDHGHRRPSWTRELLVATMGKKTGIVIHVTTMSRALARIRARRGRPRPTVWCPWSQQARTRRLNAIRRLLTGLPQGHVAVYEDEVDISLNPKIGWDWMVRGQQKEVRTPGKNVKRYVAGAVNAITGRLIWTQGQRKTSELFLRLLKVLTQAYPRAKTIHVLVDNFRIHTSRIARAAVKKFEGRIVLHFLPPYCPNDNRIERLWEDLHANVTRNHRCGDIKTLMQQVHRWLQGRAGVLKQQYLTKVA